jgi:uncharacterized phage protein (TIGR02220 family)
MKETIKIRNWDKWQSYRKDRGTPPWIKVHRGLMSNQSWALLTDAEKGQLVSLWIIAADKSGEIPADPRILRKICLLDEVPDINKFIDLGFLESDRQPDSDQNNNVGCHDDAKVTPEDCQDDVPETETETEAETEERRDTMSGKPDEVIEYLNAQSGKSFRAVESNRKIIRARLREGYAVDDLKAVVDRKIAEWADHPKMAQYIRPSTIFGAEKFSQYVGEVDQPLPARASPVNKQQAIEQQNSTALEGWEYGH